MAIKKQSPLVDKTDVMNLVAILRKNWYVFVFFIGIALLYANITIQKATNIYKVSTSVLLKTEQGQNLADEVVKGLGINRRSEDIANEIRIINSTNVIERTVDKLDLDVSYYIIGRLKTVEVFKSLPFEAKVKLNQSDYYNMPFNIDIIDDTRFSINYTLGNGSKKTLKGIFGLPVSNRFFEITVSKTDRFTNTQIDDYREAKYFFKVNTKKSLISKYQRAIGARDIDWTSIIDISVTDEIPARGVQFLDTLAAVYIETSLETRKKVINTTIEFIDDQIGDVLNVINGYESNLENFKQNNVKFDIQTENAKYLGKLTEFDAQLEQIDLQQKNMSEIKKYLETYNDTVLFSPPFKYAAGDNFLSTGLQNLYDGSLKMKSSLLNRQKDNLEYKAQGAQFRYLIESMITYIHNTQATLSKLSVQYKEQQKVFEDKLKKIPGVERELVNIQRKMEVNQSMYQFLLQRRSEVIIRKAGIIPDRKVIETAKSLGVVSPVHSEIVNYALGIALVLSLSIVFIRKTFFDTIDSVDDLKQLVDVPVIGVVNRDKEGRSTYLIIENKSRSMVAESFRSIRNNLEYLATGEKHKVILVTSANVSEGKTFTSINLATIFAKAGRKTIILEFDLHRPKVQKAFNMSNDMGISSILIGKSSLKDSIKNSPIENLDVLVSGPIPPNSSELILSNNMHAMIEELKKEYEYVIMDTPPIGVISDALVLMKFSDINLYVMKAYSSKSSHMETIHNVKDNFNPKNLGIIFNGVRPPSRIRYGKNGGQYGYGYSYGYGPSNS